MTHQRDTGRPRLRLLPPLEPPLPAVAPVLSPEQPVTPAQEVVLTGIARRARAGDAAARDLLWRAFAPKLEPSLRRCGRMAWQSSWARRDGVPWELDDLRQEAWVVFADLTASWPGEGSFVPYALAFFPWRLHSAMRRLGPVRVRIVMGPRAPIPAGEDGRLREAETALLLAALLAVLAPEDAALLQLRAIEGEGFGDIAVRLGISRRTVARRWQRIRRVLHDMLVDEPAAHAWPRRIAD